MSTSPNAPIVRKRIVSLDYGMVRIGVSVSDETWLIATPLKTIIAEKKLENTAKKVLKELALHAQDFRYVIEEIVIGMPLLLSGKSGPLADEVKAFVELLKKHTAIPIIPWDERLSTVQAERAMLESTMTRRERSKRVDSVSAVIQLQGYLDYKRIEKARQEPQI